MKEDWDIYERSEHYQPIENKMTNHSWKTFVGLGIVFVIGGLQALHGGGFESWAETLIPVLLALEHTLNGNV